jgi:hypothetical protein
MPKLDSHAAFLRNLAERIFEMPVTLGVDQGDYDRLLEISFLIDDPCIDKRQEGEPMFVLLGRDIHAQLAINAWINSREMELERFHFSNRDAEIAHIDSVKSIFAAFNTWWRKANR